MSGREFVVTLLACLGLMAASAQSDTLAAPQAPDTLIVTGGTPQPVSPEALSATDSLDWRQRHSPKKASILSAVLPGAGQIYNRKYWKAPIVWAGLGTAVYFITENSREYKRYRSAYIALVDDDPNTVDEFNGQYRPEQVLNVTDTYRRWRDLSYIGFGLVYMLNVVDASVDAHFVRFDVSRDLSMRMGPSLGTMAQGAPGVSLLLTLR